MKMPILILHGWAGDMTGERYHALAALLEKKGYDVYTPDLPGFGKNQLTKQALHFEDYLAFVKEYIEKTIKTKKVILFGHSFGGRMAIRFTRQYPGMVEKLILADASGIPQKLSPKKKILSLVAKTGKPIFALPLLSLFYPMIRKILYRGIGEMDYIKAGKLTETFKNVYNISIVSDLPYIKIPTLILWGGDDTFTPISMGKVMHERIPHSELEVISGAGHKLPYENPQAVFQKMMSFLS